MLERPFIDTTDWITAPWFRVIQPVFESLVGIRDLNKAYNTVRREQMSCAEFCSGMLEYFGIRIKIENDVSVSGNEPLMVLGNHPTGMIEALMMVVLLESLKAGGWKILSNRLVADAPEFAENAIPLDTFGTGGDPRMNARSFARARRFLKNGGCVGAFPAGRVAPGNGQNGLPKDSQWSPHLMRLARMAGARVLVASFPLSSGKVIRILPQSWPRLRGLLLSRETMRPRPGLVRIQVSELRNFSESSDTETTQLAHSLCHKNLSLR